MKKKISVLVAAALAVSAAIFAGSSTASAAENTAGYNLVKPGSLVVGMTLQFKPQMYLDEDGNPAGYDVALVKRLASDLGLKLEIKNMDFGGLIPGLVSKQFDLVSVGLTNTAERSKSILFAREYVPYSTGLFTTRKSTRAASISAWDAAGVKITALQGSSAAKLVKSTFPKATLVEFAQQNSAFLEVASGRADATVVEDYLANDYSKSNPGQIVQVKLAKPIAVGYGSWAVQLGNTPLKNRLNKWLCSKQKTRTLATIYKKEMGFNMAPLPENC